VWCYTLGVKTKPIDTKVGDYATALEAWEVDNSKLSLGSIIPSYTLLKLNWQLKLY